MVSQASSQKAMITSCALRLIVRSPDRKLVLASCCVIVLPPCRTPPPRRSATQGARDAARVDPPVTVEAPVLDRDERRRSQRVELGDVDRRFLDRAAQRDRMAVVASQQQCRVGERLERPRQRRGDHQPQQCDHNQRGHRNRAPAASGGGGVPAPADRFRPAAARVRTGPAVPRPERPSRVQIASLSATLISLAGLAQLLYFSNTVRTIYPDAC